VRQALQFWPDPGAAVEPDQVIKQTSKIAGMWHGVLFEEVRQAFPGLSPTLGQR
jgi:hypothetical protein